LPSSRDPNPLQEIEVIEEKKRLAAYPFYWATLGELELRREDSESARKHFSAALEVARNPMERRFLEQRLLACDNVSAGSRPDSHRMFS
jgi:predicted RNA polymerase sigma factor